MADLTSLADVKALLDIPAAQTDQDAKINDAITDASAAIRTYTGRNFGAADTTKSITYNYDRGGWLEIDDASAITAVVMDGITLTPLFDYVAGPDRGYLTADSAPIFEWLELRPGMGQSPQMGFARNLDTLYKFGITKRYSSVVVSGTFGWPAVPEDVKRAALWTVVEFATMPQPFNSASISAYSVQQTRAVSEAIPGRAKELLQPFRRLP